MTLRHYQKDPALPYRPVVHILDRHGLAFDFEAHSMVARFHLIEGAELAAAGAVLTDFASWEHVVSVHPWLVKRERC